MNATTPSTKRDVRLLASPATWIEAEAVRQLYALARLEGARLVAGFPNLHPGKGFPTGCTLVTEGTIHPSFLGGNIGCGMALFRTSLQRRALDLDRWAAVRFDLEHPWEGQRTSCLDRAGLAPGSFDAGLGVLAHGNHFAELLSVEKIRERAAFAQLGLASGQLLALVHAGSGELGQSILEGHLEDHGARGLAADSEGATRYLLAHDHTVRWAELCREVVAHRFLGALGGSAERVFDRPHNRIACRRHGSSQVWIHRKGSVSSEHGPIVIAGTRGSLSYLVQPRCDEERHAWSLAHGAGRKWSRSESRLRMRQRYRRTELEHTSLGGRVICEKPELLFEEAPGAFKDIDGIVADLVQDGLITVIATLRPVLTYRTRAGW